MVEARAIQARLIVADGDSEIAHYRWSAESLSTVRTVRRCSKPICPYLAG